MHHSLKDFHLNLTRHPPEVSNHPALPPENNNPQMPSHALDQKYMPDEFVPAQRRLSFLMAA
jgi:hypothetical protein